MRTATALAAAVLLAAFGIGTAAAHCDTLDGPVAQDARKALEAKDVTPVLKWVKPKDERAVKGSFARALAARGKKGEAAEERRFLETLVRVHRAGEGAPFTGLKPAGAVEPAVAEADRALAAPSPDALVKLVNDAVAAGIRERYERAKRAHGHKDESVAAGREFVEAYVDYTHYVERLHQAAAAKGGDHGGHGGHEASHAADKVGAGHGHGHGEGKR